VEDEQLDLLAASLRADSSNTRSLIEALAAKLEAALPDSTSVERRGTGLFSKDKRVEKIAISLGQDYYTLAMAGESASAARSKIVGGIAIRNEQLSLDDWLSSLTAALGAEAKRSEAVRSALERLLG
jgi:hypothetical protein